MTKSQVSRSLCGRLSAIGIPNRIKLPILNEIEKWVTQSGPEWTVQRLKDLKVDLIRSWSGLEPVSKGIRFRNGAPAGPFRALWSWTSERGKFKAVQVLMAYTSLISPSVTKKQRSKFVSSVTRDKVVLSVEGTALVDRMVATVRATKQFTTTWSYSHRYPDFDSYPWSNTRRQPDVRGRTQVEVGKGISPYDPLHNLVVSRIFLDLYRDHESLRRAVPPSLREMFDRDERFTYRSPAFEAYRRMVNFVDNVGKISFIQEPGYKLRAVANPLRIYQVALEPLKKSLDHYLRGLPGVFVHDQQAGVDWVQSKLRIGLMVHSVDLSDATNNFPLGPQVRILEEGCPLCKKDPVSLFEKVSRSPWLYRDEEGHLTSLTWTVGQPLGLGPSFALFTIAHWALLESLDRQLPGHSVEHPRFAIVGDDVAISDGRLHERYLNALQRWDVPISRTKSLSSALVAEFCGKVITRESQIPQLKYRLVSDNSFVDIARNLGPQSVSLFTPAQRRVLKVIESVPEFLGGLGWNPRGESLNIRMSRPAAQALLSAKLGKEQYLLYEQGTLRVTRHHYECNWLNERYLSPYQGPEIRPGSHLSVEHQRILESCQVKREMFRSTERPDSSWSPAERVSDPRGPSTRVRLERDLGLER